MRLWTLASIILVIPLGLATKKFPITGAEWIWHSVGGALYVVFFCLGGLLLWPQARTWVVACVVTLSTCCVELLQLWHPPWLEAVRDTTFGALLLGTTFYWPDIPWYVAGGLVGWLWCSLLRRPFQKGA